MSYVEVAFSIPIVNVPKLSGDVTRLPSYGFTSLGSFDLLGVALAFRISILKIFKLLQNYLHRVTDVTGFEKHLESSAGHTLTFYLNLVKYRFKNMFRNTSLNRSFTVI